MDTTTKPARNATFETFGGLATLIADYHHWSVQARPKQATLGAMVLLAHGDARAFGDLPGGAHGELTRITRDIEATAQRLGCQKINYLMLMMVDPHVHFHVLPRYPSPVEFEGINFIDPGWPGVPDLTAAPAAPDATAKVCAALRAAWPKPAR